jgi:hypothetical protein
MNMRAGRAGSIGSTALCGRRFSKAPNEGSETIVACYSSVLRHLFTRSLRSSLVEPTCFQPLQ